MIERVLLATVILFSSLELCAQQKVLDVEFNGAGMAFPRGRHLYLQVYATGEAVFEKVQKDESGVLFLKAEIKLSKAEMSSLQVFLNTKSIKNLKEEYGPLSAPLDHFVELRITIIRGSGKQEILVVNYSKNDGFPAKLEELLCRIEQMRKGALFSLVADDVNLCEP